MNSWFKSDSSFDNGDIKICENDLGLMKRLFKLGTEQLVMFFTIKTIMNYLL